MGTASGNNQKGTIIVKLIGLISALILTFSAFLGHRPLLGIAFIIFGLMMIYEGYVIAIRNRVIGYKDQLPFIIPFFLCVLFDLII
jgi:hypothetical protein